MLLNRLICGFVIALAVMLLPTPAAADFYIDEWGGVNWSAADRPNTTDLSDSGYAVGQGGLAPSYGYAGRYEYTQRFGGPFGYAGSLTAPYGYGSFHSTPYGYAGAYSGRGFGSHTFSYTNNNDLSNLREQFENWFDD